MTTIPKKYGYTCGCGKHHDAGHPWVVAHWYEKLLHKCDACGAKNTILSGKVVETDKPKKKRGK